MKINRSRVLVVSALALASASAFADGPSFYALVDGGIASSSITGAGTTASKSEFVTGGVVPTFAGLKFEKTDSGITYGVQVEQGFTLNSPSGSFYSFGNGDLLNRQKNFYISSGAGKFVFGVQGNIAFGNVLMADPRGGSNFGSSLAMIDANGGLNTVDNASLSYTSPSMSGFTVAAQYVPESSTASADVKTGSRAAIGYSSGNLTLGLSTYTSQINNTVNLTTCVTPGCVNKDSTGTILGFNYKMGVFTLKGISASQTNTTFTSALTTNGVGGSYTLSDKVSFDLGYYNATSSVKSFKVDTTALGAYYSLGKDLKVYGQYAVVDNKGGTGADSAWNFAGPTIITGTITPGQKAEVMNVGLIFSYF